MNINEQIRSQARMNADEIQGVIDEAENNSISISGLLVIREDISRMVKLYANNTNNQDYHGDDHVYNNIIIELEALNDEILIASTEKKTVEEKRIVNILMHLRDILYKMCD